MSGKKLPTTQHDAEVASNAMKVFICRHDAGDTEATVAPLELLRDILRQRQFELVDKTKCEVRPC